MIRWRDLGLPAERLTLWGEGGIGGWGVPRESLLEALRGAMRAREPFGGEPLASVPDGEGAIEMGMEVDAQAGIAPAAEARSELEEAPIELDGVIVLDGAPVLEAADRVEISTRGGWAPGWLGMRGGLSEAYIVAGEKPGEHTGSLRERAGLGEAEFDHQAVLKSAEEAFNPTLRLRGVGPDPLDAQVAERTPDLGLARGPAELLVKGERGAGIRTKDAMAIGVHGGRETIAAEELPEQEEVAMCILLEAKDGAQHPPRGVINGGEEDEAGAAVLEPGMMTAIELDEEACLRHALPPAAMARGATSAGAANACLPQQAVDRGAGEVNVLALCQELGKVAIIAAPVAGAGQREHARADRSGAASRGLSPTVTMGQGGQALLAHFGEEPADMTDREFQQLRRCQSREESRVDPWQDLPPLLLFPGQSDRLPSHSPRVTESLNSYGVTDSLNSYKQNVIVLTAPPGAPYNYVLRPFVIARPVRFWGCWGGFECEPPL